MDMELEAAGSLMAQIQELIKPPPSETPLKVKKKEKDVERRRGKGQNRDTCDACGDCGSLICCEKCPTALHLFCQDPPLDEDDVPLGEWLCRECRTKPKSKDNKKCLEDNSETFTPLHFLIKAVAEQNPTQYELSEKLKLPIPFPGAEKGPTKVTTRRGSSLKKNVPEPVRLCFECQRGARIAPLLHCDHCSCSYHLDCLNPPLTAPPSGITWMCPNHPEHFLDQNLLTSVSGMERARLWEKAAKDLDQHAVKLEFLRKGSRKNPPFRFKVHLPDRHKVQVPAAITNMYKNPLPLVPALPNNVKYVKTWKNGETPTESETEQWLSSLFQLQLSLAWNLTKSGDKEQVASKEDRAVDGPHNPEAVEEMMEQMFSSEPKRNQKLNRAAVEKFCSALETDSPLDAQVSKLDPKLLKLLACQRLLQLMPQFKNGAHSMFDRSLMDHKVKIKEENPISDSYAVFDENLYLKNGVVCSKKKYVALKDVNGGLKVEEWNDVRRRDARTPVADGQEQPNDKLPPARAALAPIGSVQRVRPVAMRKRTLTIGTSPDNDVCLSEFGSCSFASPKHAVIFYDAMTGVYELLNYSPHGTVVDGVQYCIDSTQCRIPSAPTVADPLVQGVRAMLDKRRGLKRLNGNVESVPTLTPAPPKRLCSCRNRVSDPTGWEGSAIIQHCTHLVFGCLQFVFSVADFAPGKVSPEAVERKKVKLDESEVAENEVSSMVGVVEENGEAGTELNQMNG